MIENVTGIFLRIFTKHGIYDIPFKDFEQLDEFTVQFSDEKELINKVFFGYGHLINKIEINYVYKNGKEVKTKKAPIKFIDDNFNEKDLKDKYCNYLERHPSEAFLDKWKVNYAIKNGRLKSGKNTGAEVSSTELELAIESTWNKGYKTKRDIYFALKKISVDVEILPTLSFDERQLSINDRIRLMKSEDPYVEYLQSALKNDGDSRDFVMEQLLMFDLDKLSHMGAPFDGSSDWEKLDILLEHSKSLSPAKKKLLVLEVEKIRNDFLKTFGKKKCRK